MAKTSAGLLLYRKRSGKLEVLLVHPGGPFWAKKDAGAWSIPKGEAEPGEDLLERARRELHEETGFRADGPFTPLHPVKQTNKIVYAWAAEGDGETSSIISNTFTIEYPPRSGKMKTFPEVDKAEWFDLEAASEKILPTQRSLLHELQRIITK
jgi:predicted NUDIX family NTP pyrophosphohydrolase